METEGEREGHETQRAEGRRHQLPSVKTQASGPSARARHASKSRRRLHGQFWTGARDRSEVLIFRPIFVCLPVGNSSLPKQRQAGPPGKQQEGTDGPDIT